MKSSADRGQTSGRRGGALRHLLASAIGAKAIVTSSSDEKLTRANSLGVIHGIITFAYRIGRRQCLVSLLIWVSTRCSKLSVETIWFDRWQP